MWWWAARAQQHEGTETAQVIYLQLACGSLPCRVTAANCLAKALGVSKRRPRLTAVSLTWLPSPTNFVTCCRWVPCWVTAGLQHKLASVFRESSGRNLTSPRSGPCLTPGVLGRGAGGSKSVSFEAWKQIQLICTAAPAGGCVKNTGSSCRARRNVAPFVFTKHRVVVDSAFSGEEILIAFPSLPFSLMAQHVVKLSRASLGNTEDGLLVEKSCSSLGFLLHSQMEILPSTGQKALWLNPLSCVARWGLLP